MISFANDYAEGAHEAILQRLLETNLEQLPGYGADKYCESAAEKIRAACGCPQADVRFLVGGTQTNAVVISSLLHNWEGVAAAQTGHINTHEAGAIEAAGHKVMPLPQHGGKLAAGELEDFLSEARDDSPGSQMLQAGMVYISHPTEYGTLYSRDELEKLSAVCRRYGIPLYLDGARLGYGLASSETDVTLEDVARCCDVFYIGGTKVGALCGEAVVFTRGSAPKHFLATMKQHGALLAKGRLLGVQFDTLFTDGLYLRISRRAIETAEKMKNMFREKGYEFFIESPTNQQFIILENDEMERLKDKAAFSVWQKYDEHRTVVRFATSWATRSEDIEYLSGLLG